MLEDRSVRHEGNKYRTDRMDSEPTNSRLKPRLCATLCQLSCKYYKLKHVTESLMSKTARYCYKTCQVLILYVARDGSR